MAIEIVDFPIKNGGFSIAMLVYQRVYGCICYWFVSFQPCRHVRSKNPGFLQTKWAISLKHFHSYRVVHPQLSVGYCWFKLRIYIHIYHYINLLNRVSVGYCWFISLHELSIYIYISTIKPIGVIKQPSFHELGAMLWNCPAPFLGSHGLTRMPILVQKSC